MKNLRSINNQLYIYEGFNERHQLHILSEVLLDDDGIMTATHSPVYFTTEALTHDDISWITLDQWYGIVEAFIRNYHDYLDEEEILNATEDIVNRAFRYGIPKMHELYDYINDHLDR